jgi:hypothetical protein
MAACVAHGFPSRGRLDDLHRNPRHAQLFGKRSRGLRSGQRHVTGSTSVENIGSDACFQMPHAVLPQQVNRRYGAGRMLPGPVFFLLVLPATLASPLGFIIVVHADPVGVLVTALAADATAPATSRAGIRQLLSKPVEFDRLIPLIEVTGTP